MYTHNRRRKRWEGPLVSVRTTAACLSREIQIETCTGSLLGQSSNRDEREENIFLSMHPFSFLGETAIYQHQKLHTSRHTFETTCVSCFRRRMHRAARPSRPRRGRPRRVLDAAGGRERGAREPRPNGYRFFFSSFENLRAFEARSWCALVQRVAGGVQRTRPRPRPEDRPRL